MRDSAGKLLPGHSGLKARSLRTLLRGHFNDEDLAEAIAELRKSDPASYLKLAIELANQRPVLPQKMAFA